ncbi:MAG: phage tail protein [Pacificimonas sp.]|jgi:hypothetical protein|nr:phage tail protein [Pacificimonas sp.]
MRKAQDLRKWLLRSVPGLAKNPDQLKTYLSEGGIDFQRPSRPGGPGDLSFGYRYQLAIVLTDFAHSLDRLMVPFIIWLAEHEPQLIDKAGSADFRFIVDQLDNEKSDIEIVLRLGERVTVDPNPDVEGGYIAEHRVGDHSAFRIEGAPTLSCLWLDQLGGDRLLAAKSGDADCE